MQGHKQHIGGQPGSQKPSHQLQQSSKSSSIVKGDQQQSCWGPGPVAGHPLWAAVGAAACQLCRPRTISGAWPSTPPKSQSCSNTVAPAGRPFLSFCALIYSADLQVQQSV